VHGLDPHLNVDDELIMERGDESAADYERLSGIAARFVPDLRAAVSRAPTKVLAVGESGLPERLLEEARRHFARKAQVTVSHPEYLEWTAPGVHKGRAMRWLARRSGVPLSQVLAVGDQFNDLEMLAIAGHGVAMGGAPAPVRAAARYVTAAFEEDGAALALEALALGRGSLD
jgi:HAD superfamily hydrolase (TIGR01484 family)